MKSTEIHTLDVEFKLFFLRVPW